MRAADLALLVLLGAIWGASYLFIRVAAPALGPIPLMWLRVLIAGAVLLLVARMRQSAPPRRGRWRAYLLLGTLNNVIPFVGIATAELVVTAGLAAILNATSPFFTVIVAAIWTRARPSAMQVAGTIVGFAGVAALVGLGPLDPTPEVLVAIALLLIAALSYAVAAVFVSRAFRGDAPVTTAAGQLSAAALILTVPAAFTRTPSAPDATVIASLLALALLGTSVGYLIYLGLIERAGPARAISVTLLIPVFGVALGAVFLGEPVGPGLLIGLVLILVGVALTIGLVRPGAQSSQNGAT